MEKWKILLKSFTASRLPFAASSPKTYCYRGNILKLDDLDSGQENHINSFISNIYIRKASISTEKTRPAWILNTVEVSHYICLQDQCDLFFKYFRYISGATCLRG
jgi:hypothetical protein